LGRVRWIGAGVLAVVAAGSVALIDHHRRSTTPHIENSTETRQLATASGGSILLTLGRNDVSGPLASLHVPATDRAAAECDEPDKPCGNAPPRDEDEDAEEAETEQAEAKPATATDATVPKVNAAGAAVEQTVMGKRPAAVMAESFDGLGVGFVGPLGEVKTRNPSDNSLAVGPDHIVQIVNSRMAVYTKRGAKFDTTGKVIFGPVVTNTIFAGFGGQCEKRTSGDAVVRYDQLAGRWLYVLPIFQRPPDDPKGPYSMCYAVSQGADPTGPYYRYEFKRPLFPDYPRPAIWPDGYYIPTSTGDTVIQKHACVADRAKMLLGQPATEQCVIVDAAGFLNNTDIDGQQLPPPGAPNIIMAAGGTQLKQVLADDGIYTYQLHVDWQDPSKTRLTGPVKIAVAPYHYLCDGQLTKCVPQKGTDVRLDAQGDKLMQRLVYRRIGKQESIVGLHSVDTLSGGGGVRWYEFRLDKDRAPLLYQQGTYAPGGDYRWMGSIAMDKHGDIGMGYSYGSAGGFAGQRFTGRIAKDPKGQMTLTENVLATGGAAQTNTLRWQDYTTTAMDPGDDCTFWYVGDYVQSEGESYRTRIGAFRMGACAKDAAKAEKKLKR
jgi:hypothetical protein